MQGMPKWTARVRAQILLYHQLPWRHQLAGEVGHGAGMAQAGCPFRPSQSEHL